MKINRIGSDLPMGAFLWRYFDFHKFLSFLNDELIFFSRMDSMEDVNEGISRNQLLLKYGDEFEKRFVEQDQLERGVKDYNLNLRQRKIFLSCWFVHHRESVAMWNSYSNNSGIAIRVKVSELIEHIISKSTIINDKESTLEFLYHGQVDYKDYLNPKDRQQLKDVVRVLGFHKDISFNFENEYRFVLKQNIKKNRDNDLPFVKLKLNSFKDLQFEIIFHPKMESWKKDNIHTLLKKYRVKSIITSDSELQLKSW